MKHGYKVTLIEGHSFYKAKLFNEYIDHFYNIKKQSKGAARFIAKMHLNQLYGYFGRTQDTIVTHNVTRAELKQLMLTSCIDAVMKINDNLFVVLVKGNLSQSMIQGLNQMKQDLV